MREHCYHYFTDEGFSFTRHLSRVRTSAQKCCQSSSRFLKLNVIRNKFIHGSDQVL